MVSSKFPIDFVHVSEALIRLSQTNTKVHRNIRPWKIHPKYRLAFDGDYMDPVLRTYCKEFLQPHDRILLHFQGYGEETGTAIIELLYIYIGERDYPRLDFHHPPEMVEIHGCPNFWGAFILAMARVPPDTPIMCAPDADGSIFIRLAEELTPKVKQPTTPAHPAK